MGVSIIKKGKVSLKKKSQNKVNTKQVYREIITPSQKKVSIILPETVVGKRIEVFAFEVSTSVKHQTNQNRQFSTKDFWETFGSGKASTISSGSIRENAWRKYKW